jgi:hypothetical protein
MRHIPSLSIFVMALASSSCGEGQGVQFAIYTPDMSSIAGIQIEVCGKSIPMQQSPGAFIVSAEVKCEGRASVFVMTSEGTTIECDGLYVTPGMERLEWASARLVLSERTCHLEPIDPSE